MCVVWVVLVYLQVIFQGMEATTRTGDLRYIRCPSCYLLEDAVKMGEVGWLDYIPFECLTAISDVVHEFLRTGLADFDFVIANPVSHFDLHIE
jgi:hypothetical protein